VGISTSARVLERKAYSGFEEVLAWWRDEILEPTIAKLCARSDCRIDDSGSDRAVPTDTCPACASVSHSDDGGQTWSEPEKVNQTPSDTFIDQAFEPAVHVNDEGVVAVSYYDFRNDVSGDGQLTTDHWVVRSADGGATWNEDHLGGPFDLHQAPYARGYFVGDYQGLDSQGSAFRALFTLASPGSDTVFPNPNPTDEFISDPF
jgi:hypothetical protein